MPSELLFSLTSGATWLPVLDAVSKATILLGLAGVISVALRRGSAATRHLVWTLALVSAMALPILSFTLPRWQLPILTISGGDPAPLPAGDSSGAEAPALERSTAVAPSTNPAISATEPATGSGNISASWMPEISWPAALLLVWAAGTLLILGRLALGVLAVLWMSRRTERVIDAPWLPLARELAASLGVTPRILFLRSGRATMPMAWGMLLPSVLMPKDADTWPAERLRIVLLHELAHVKRRDCLTHMLAQVACAVYWFNPLAWIAARHVRTERERACDDLVLAAGTRGPDYADQLLEIARVMRAGRFPGLLAGASLAMAQRSQLEGRLMAILDPTVPRAGVSRLRTIGAIAVFAIVLMPLASMQPWTYAATPIPGVTSADGTSMADQNPTPTPSPTPTPMPTPGAGARGANKSVDRSIEHGVQGAVESALANMALNPQVHVDPQVHVNTDVNVNVNKNIHENMQHGPRKPADPKAVAALSAALKDSDADVRETAMQALVQMRDPSIYEPLVQALSDTAPGVREQAVVGLGQLRDKRAVGPLTNALKDSNADVREQAAFALGQLRDRSAVPGLTAALGDEADDVREQAVFALGQLRDPSTVEPLTRALRDAKPNVREQAAFALGQLRDKSSVEPLISALKDADADVREQAAFGLGQLRDRGAVEALVIALKDKDADVREQCAFALGQLRDPRAIDGLTDALKDASADVRQQAAFALGQIAR